MSTSSSSAHSAEVRAELIVGEQRYCVANLGPGCIVLREGQQIAAGNAWIELTVDGELRRWEVNLPHGAVPFDTEIRVERCGE